MKSNKRKIGDTILNLTTIISTLLMVLILSSIIIYIFTRGVKTLSWKFLFSDYYEELTIVETDKSQNTFSNPNIKNTYFSEKYGIALKNDMTLDGNRCITIEYIAVDSPFNVLKIVSSNESYKAKKGESVDVLMGETNDSESIFASVSDGAKVFCEKLNKADKITYLQCATSGGGIRGSLLATILLILLTLIFTIPLGIGGSIYLTLYAKEGKLKTILTNMIDATNGIPSIIFGFVGSLIFIPLVSLSTKRIDYSILAGALTMSIVLLPTVIKTVNESLMVVPKEYMMGSLALGATKSQTVFKVILPNAIPGILSAVLLSIGRIIGESAALVFVMGTAIKDHVSIFQGATSLSLHIWSLTKAENPNYDTACAISIIILLVVFIMNIVVKIISSKINKKRGM